MKTKHKVVLTHGAALLAGAAIAVAVTYNPPSHAQMPPAAAPVASKPVPRAGGPVTAGYSAPTEDEDSAANGFDQINAQAIQSDRAYREWLRAEAAKAPR